MLVNNFRVYLLTALSGILLVFSFVPWNFSSLSWIALIPLLIILLPFDAAKNCRTPFRYGYVTGLIFWFGTVYWLYHVTIPGMIGMGLYMGLYLGVWAWFIVRIRERWSKPTGISHCLIAFFGAVSWVGLEWIRGWMLGGFPWNNFGVSQYQNLAIIQISAWTGVYGISFIIVFFNITLWLTWRRLVQERFSFRSWRYEFSVALFLVFFTMFIGLKILWKSHDKTGTTLSLGFVQPDIPQAVKYEPMSRSHQQDRFRNLTMLLTIRKPDLILWPETAVVDGPSYHLQSKYWLQGVVNEVKVPILFGTLDSSEDDKKSADGKHIRYYNAAMMINIDGTFGPVYRKLHLVPFGEYIPFEKWLPWMRWLTPIPGSFFPGDAPVLFDFKGLKLGTVICFEDTLPKLTNQIVRNGADVLVNLSNDAWFKTSCEPDMHAVNAIFRAVETNRPLIRCTNHGLTTIVAPTGQILFQGELFKQGAYLASVTCRPGGPITFYTKHGDWFAILCFCLTIVGWGISSIKRV